MKTAYYFEFGTIFMEYEEQTLLTLRSVPEQVELADDLIRQRCDFTEDVFHQVEEFLAGKRVRFDVRYLLRGTPFRMKVWQALQEIPYGQTRTYGEIAEQVGNPRASRAVGAANNANPIMLIVPCHRVIGADGSLTGYAGGPLMKQYLLDMERKGNDHQV
jgi:methylated-DNA-[protein]-cysteine S-methyltransferase